MWAYVPSAGAVLADWGADVIKIEPPNGDPIRGLLMAGIPPGHNGLTFMWEIYNRGKRSVALDLRNPASTEMLRRMVEKADVFLVSLLPNTRRALGIDLESIRAMNRQIIYAQGTGQGPHGDEANNGGYDAMTFWARSGVSDAVTPSDYPHPIGMPVGAFGDSLSGAILAGGIAAAIALRDRTGHSSVVDGSLMSAAMWAMQAGIVGSGVLGVDAIPKMTRDAPANPLVTTYRTKDGRYIALNMLQQDKYWPRLCEVLERPDLVDDPLYATSAARRENISACIGILDAIFLSKTLDEWRLILATQEGQWDVLKKMGEMRTDQQALANGYVQDVDYGDGRHLDMVSAPVQFDGSPAKLQAAPELGADTEAVLQELGLDWDQIIEAKLNKVIL